MKPCLHALLVAFAIATAGAQAHAAAALLPPATIVGTVNDNAGRPIAGAHVTLEAVSASFHTHTDTNGSFSFYNIVPGDYTLTGYADGFAPLDHRSVHVAAGEKVELALILSRANSSSIVRLGVVRINGSEALSTSSAPVVNIDPQRLAEQGVEQIVGPLGQQIGVTITQPNGAAAGAPALVSLRGPDPQETLVEIDGHQMNSANVGDFDLETLDPSMLSNVQVVYGIGPSSLGGANTQGGAVNFRTVEPTAHDAGLLRVSFGSFGTSSAAAQATGTSDRLGYAFAWHRYNTDGAVKDFAVTDDQSLGRAVLGSTITSTSMLTKLRYSFGRDNGYLELIYRDTAGYRDLSAPLSTPDDPGKAGQGALFTSYAGSAALTNQPAYGLDLQLPLGSPDEGARRTVMMIRHLTSLSSQTVQGPPTGNTAVDLSPWLIDNKDYLYDDSVMYDRQLATSDLTLGVDIRTEKLVAPSDFAPDKSAQGTSQRAYLARYEWEPQAHLRYIAGVYFSDFSTFGTSLDPRAAIVWTPSDSSVLRASVGTGFAAPTLPQLFFPSVLPPQGLNGFISVGNPHLTAEHTTEYELGYEHRFGGANGMHATVNAYHTNLRDSIFTFIPQPIPCVITKTNPCLSYPTNIGNAVYRGADVELAQPLAHATTVSVEYGVSSAYPVAVPLGYLDPTAPVLVAGEQFQGIPVHTALVAISREPTAGLWWSATAAYQGVNNQLNRPAHTVYDASVGYTLGRTTAALTCVNIGNEFDSRFTLPNAGVPYPGASGPVATNAYALPPRMVTLTLTEHL
jgi:outer membrane receptor protein involved in Fe transport